MRETGWRTYAPGASLVLLGGFIAFIAAGYPLGSLFRPGPGFFPLAIALILVALGIGVMIENHLLGAVPDGESDRADETAPPWRPLFFTALAMLAFAFLAERAGFVPATIALVLVSALAERRPHWRAIAGVALFMAVFGTLVFIYGLGLPIRPFGAS